MRNIQIPSNLIDELKVPQIIDITDALPKLKPNGWDKLDPPRKLEALTDIVWHHSGMSLSLGCDALSHANSHIKKGEGGCPYHFHIKDGQISQTQDILTFTWGVSSNNYQTVHVCVEGCYAPVKNEETGVWTPADELSEDNLRAMISLELTLRPLLPSYKQSNGHNYYKSTLCPGYSMTKFREAVAATEAKLSFSNTEAGLNERAYRIANSILFIYNTAKGLDQFGKPTVSEGTRKWAQQRLLLLEQPMKENNLLG